MNRWFLICGLMAFLLAACTKEKPDQRVSIDPGERPVFLVGAMEDSALKQELSQCRHSPMYPTDFSIGHRGAPLHYPEHTRESYIAAVQMGAGIVECDVTFTKDKVLVCRHSQCDLHRTTDILARPELAQKCSVPFSAAEPERNIAARVKCCTTDLTLEEFKTLRGKRDSANLMASSADDYMTLPATDKHFPLTGAVMTHRESIALFQSLGVKMTPELKRPEVPMPFQGLSQTEYAEKLLEEYVSAGVAPQNVYPQSFYLDDIALWRKRFPRYAERAIWLDGRYTLPAFRNLPPEQWRPSLSEIRAMGINIIAPPIWVLLSLDKRGEIVPSNYARQARAAGLDIVTWSLERSGSLTQGGGWYYQSIAQAIKHDGDMMKVVDVLASDVGVMGIFSDWPATVTYYANCKPVRNN